MNLHEHIRIDMQSIIESQATIEIVSPSSLALAIQGKYEPGDLEPHIKFSSLEGLKQIARGVLSGRYDVESDESEAMSQDMFAGHLQARYPVPRKRGEEPVYKLRSALTPEERAWNVRSLRASARARLLHADALEAEGQFHEAVA